MKSLVEIAHTLMMKLVIKEVCLTLEDDLDNLSIDNNN